PQPGPACGGDARAEARSVDGRLRILRPRKAFHVSWKAFLFYSRFIFADVAASLRDLSGSMFAVRTGVPQNPERSVSKLATNNRLMTASANLKLTSETQA